MVECDEFGHPIEFDENEDDIDANKEEHITSNNENTN